MEETIKWYFGPGGAEAHGPQDSITRTFTGNKYYSLAREVIQNSLDAVLDRSQPVRVAFSIFELDRETMPGMFDLKKVIGQCQEYYSDVAPFSEFCNRAIRVLSEDSLKCLKISDYNTKGLVYGEGKTPFYAFMEAVGYTLKDSASSGGSFGFGKGAYYAASGLRTMIVSSVYGSNKFVFQGKARLTTHFDEANCKKDYTGLLGLGGAEPITDQSIVPFELVRTEKGTDVVLPGFDDNDRKWKDELIKSVLNNFWYAIWSKELVVDVDNVKIDHSTLEALIQAYYDETELDGKTHEPEGWNPYPYFKAVRNKNGPNNRYFEEELSTLGLCRMFVALGESLPNRTMFVRAPKMTVFKRTNNRVSNYVAVFECASDKGNMILRAMENPEHNEWRKTNYLIDESPHPDAIKAELEISKFVNECLTKIQAFDETRRQKILGLEEYLTIPEDLLADEEGTGSSSSDGSDRANIVNDDESPIELVKPPESPLIVSPVVTKSATLARNSEGSQDGDDESYSGKLGGDGSGVGNQPGDFPGRNAGTGGKDGGAPVKIPISIRSRVATKSTESGGVLYTVKIISEMTSEAEIVFFTGGDNDASEDDGAVIIAANSRGRELSCEGNKIKCIELLEGENILTVEFDSNIKLALRLICYEL